jgi:hypothetical protein
MTIGMEPPLLRSEIKISTLINFREEEPFKQGYFRDHQSLPFRSLPDQETSPHLIGP